MCNFVLRPIKSYATLDLVDRDETVIKRGDFVEVTHVERMSSGVEGKGSVAGYLNGEVTDVVTVPLDIFVHCFTANPDDVEKVRKEEHKTMGYDPNKQANAKKTKDKS